LPDAPNRPFLTTRETFSLTLEQWPTLAKRYLAANEADRRALLANTVDRLPLSDVAAMRALGIRGDMGRLGWFASASTRPLSAGIGAAAAISAGSAPSFTVAHRARSPARSSAHRTASGEV
jgi:hypothetical protein